MKTKRMKLPTKQDFVGAQMANFMYALCQDGNVPVAFRTKAKELQTKWDSIARFQLNNPIVAAELEKKLFS